MISENASAVPIRTEIPESDKWDLTHLFANIDKWREDFAWVRQTFPRLKEWRGKLDQSAKSLADFLEFEKSIESLHKFLQGHLDGVKHSGIRPD